MNSEIREGILYLSGEITVKTLDSTTYQPFCHACQHANLHAIDLADVSRADSACVSLLLTALRHASSPLALHHLPASVQALAELYEIQDWVQPNPAH